jgi:glycosyltransferase involved in cell wall biosynthesis
LLKRASKLIAVAEFEIDYYAQRLHLPRERFAHIPNGADLPVVSPDRRRAVRAGTLIASVGRLERYKGHQHVIAALPYVLRERPEARLWIAGTGTYERKLRALSERLGVAEKVDIRSVPPADRVRMAEQLCDAAVVVLASEYETHPIAAIEAAALGRPLVVADTPGLRELANRGVARIVSRVDDPECLARAVLAEICAPTAVRRIELPSWDDCARDLCEVYEQVRRSAS